MWSEKPRIIFDHRLEIISWVWVGIFFFLALNLWYLCVFQFNLYQKKSDLNRIRVIPLQAPRGTIYDRDGKVLAQDVPRFAAILLPGSGDPQEARQKLEGILGRTLNDPLRERFSGEIILTSQIQSEELARVEEAKKDLPGIMLEAFPRRAYPAGESVFHVLGYVGKINAEELGRFDEAEYNGEDVVGKNGIELFYENILRGEKGYRKIEVDALGRIVRMLDSSPPRFRHSLVLSIDLDLQNFCYQLLGGKGGVIIVGKPKTGEILALVSSPGFDPNVLADGISQEAWNRLLNDPQRPLNQRFLQSLYPPGSIFKLIVGLAAVEQGLEDTKRTIFCPGYFDYNGWRCPCWRKSGHGRLNFEEAIAQSCNVTFYTLGLELTERRIDEMAERFQFGEKRDIDLPGEGHGFLPTSRWKRQKTGEPWYPGDTINLSIGQGYLLVTPFEIYSMVTTIANRGKIYKPHLVKKILDEKGEVVTKVVPTIENTVKIKEQAWDQIIRGMGKVVSTGTGKACQDLPIKMAGKTGTAQNPQGADHSWFAGFFPLNDPEVSFVVLVEHGGDGSGEAAHRGRDLVQWYLENRGISQDETR